MINKELFITCLNQIQRDMLMADSLDDIFKTYNKRDFLDGYGFINPDITGLLVQVLDKSFDEDNDIISYFVYDLNCGKNWYPGCIVDENNNDIDISTMEKLYQYLTDTYK